LTPGASLSRPGSNRQGANGAVCATGHASCAGGTRLATVSSPGWNGKGAGTGVVTGAPPGRGGPRVEPGPRSRRGSDLMNRRKTKGGGVSGTARKMVRGAGEVLGSLGEAIAEGAETVKDAGARAVEAVSEALPGGGTRRAATKSKTKAKGK